MNNTCDYERKPIKGVLLMQIMTVKEYARKAGISSQAVTAALRRGKPHSGIINFNRFGHQWSLDVIPGLIKKDK